MSLFQTPFIKQEGFNPDSPTNTSSNNPPSPGPFDPSTFFGGTMFPDAFRSKFSDNPNAIDFDDTLASMMADTDPPAQADHAHGFHPTPNDSQQPSYDPPPMDLRFPSQQEVHSQPSSFDVGHQHYHDHFPIQHHSQPVAMDHAAIHNGEVYFDPTTSEYRNFPASSNNAISISRLLSNMQGSPITGRPNTPGSSIASPVDSVFSGIVKKASPPSPSRSRSRTRLSKPSVTGARTRTGRKRDSITSPPPMITPPSSVGSRPQAIVIPNAANHIHVPHPSSPLGLNIPTHATSAPAWFMPNQQESPYGQQHPQTFAHAFGNMPNGQSMPVNQGGPQPPADVAQKQAALLNEKRRRRRESHNAVERRRRDNINEKISELATLLPENLLDSALREGADISKVDNFSMGNGMSTSVLLADEDGKESPGVKANKGMILRKSVEYIRILQQLVQAQANRNRELEEELSHYRPAADVSGDGQANADDTMTGILIANSVSRDGSETKPLLSDVDGMTLHLSPLADEHMSEEPSQDSRGVDTSPSVGSGGADDDDDDGSSRMRGRDRERTGGRFGLQRAEADDSALSDGDGASMED